MAANYRVTFFFESLQQATLGSGAALGWTESWYTVPTADSMETIATNTINGNMLAYRVGFLASIYRVSFVRINDDANPRMVKIFTVPPNKGQGKVPPVQSGNSGFYHNTPLQVQCSILVDFEWVGVGIDANNRVAHRRMQFRGLPDNLVNGNVINDHGENWQEFLSFVFHVGQKIIGQTPRANQRYTNLFGMRAQDMTVNPVKITSINTNGNDQRLLEIQPGSLLLSEKKKVQVFGLGSPYSQYNKLYTIKYRGAPAATPPAPMVVGRIRRNVQGFDLPNPPSAFYREVKYLYGFVTQAAIIGVRSKRTGRIFRQLRGRSRSRD